MTRGASLLEALPVPVVIWRATSRDFVLETFNPAAATLSRGRLDTCRGTLAGTLFDPASRMLEDLRRCRTEGSSIRRELPCPVIPGLELDCTLACLPPDRVLQVVHDLTDQRRLEREIIEIAERERRQIGLALHDDLGQQLTGIGYLTQGLVRRLEDRGATAEARTAAQIHALQGDALAQIRALSRGLFSLNVEIDGLESALGELSRQFVQVYPVQCHASVSLDAPSPVGELAVQLFHIAQEAALNAVRHAGGRAIEIALSSRPDGGLRLAVSDDGRGPPDGAQPGDGMGLRMMRYRAQLIGAAIRIEALEVGGTCVTCDVPTGALGVARGAPVSDGRSGDSGKH